jgi:hypothetical protein
VSCKRQLGHPVPGGNKYGDLALLKEIMDILEIILEQNYFEFNKQFYKQTEGLAMGAPTSAILAEIYIQYIEHKQLYPVLLKQKSSDTSDTSTIF